MYEYLAVERYNAMWYEGKCMENTLLASYVINRIVIVGEPVIIYQNMYSYVRHEIFQPSVVFLNMSFSIFVFRLCLVRHRNYEFDQAFLYIFFKETLTLLHFLWLVVVHLKTYNFACT